ncbi:MAG: ferredoxin--NADP reductase [Rhodocyclaceae bacterium]|jgi:ferredoxin--NADP+ reductase|nr:MAG: ferredoxin--NADP reductase [Rhodocyclaceae bacterium]
MSQWTEGRVAANHAWTARLHSLQVEAEIAPFAAGQFIRLGLIVDGAEVGRPYSLVNPPHARPLEFCFSVVPGGPLSGRLAAMRTGDALLVAPRANGFLVLSEVPDCRRLWLVSTGTGIGPFLSILRTDEPWRRFERLVLVHAVRLAAELIYRDAIDDIAAARGGQFAYVPFVSRETTDFAQPGRIPQAIADGSLEARAGAAFDAQSHIMLCGNPQMVADAEAALVARGLRKHRRREPGHISVENYW